MIVLDRKVAPLARSIEKIKFPEIESRELSNGIPVYFLNAGSQEVIKIDLVMEAGQWFSDNVLVPNFCNRMLIEGSERFSHSEIADKLDFYGTFSSLECGKHFSQIQLFTLSHFFDKSVEILEDFVKKPAFPEDKLKILLQNEVQQFIVNHEKTDVLAADEFIPRIFGRNHPYGKIREYSDFEHVNLDDLKYFHGKFYNSSNCKILVSGKLHREVMDVLEHHFGKQDWSGEKAIPEINGFDHPEPGKFKVKKKNAVQSSILVGNKTINKKHPDYFGLSVLNTILGGYFGSRLMIAIREKEALTYGIYSSLSSALHSGTFSISANVNSKLVEKAIKAIYREVDRLKTELLSLNELETVKSYLSGEMLRAFDGPLAVSEIFSDLLPYGLELDYYQDYFETLKNIDPETIRDLAEKYFVNENFTEVIAGNL